MREFPSMSKMHFRFIADTLKMLPEDKSKEAKELFAKRLKFTNPRFKLSKFLYASGYWK